MKHEVRYRRGLATLALAGLVSWLSIASPAHAQSIFGKLGKLADTVERKVEETNQRVEQGERTKQSADAVLGRLGVRKRSAEVEQPEAPEPGDPAMTDAPTDVSDTAFPGNLPVYPGARRVETTDPRVPVVFYAAATGDQIVAFYAGEGQRRGFQAFKTSNPYPGLVLLDAQEKGVVLGTIPDGKGTRFFVNDGSAFASE
ncbi:hypothetical protein ABS767_12705 [Sphingomonas sp. ST-64]|uniref:Uncharacterized protein n=1 Tax=Sphingomonas plantiphila TaxID=3163295 RepID=A0ABW8YPI6_9SPHN